MITPSSDALGASGTVIVGDAIGADLHAQGYTELYFATGEFDHRPLPSFIKGNVG